MPLAEPVDGLPTLRRDAADQGEDGFAPVTLLELRFPGLLGAREFPDVELPDPVCPQLPVIRPGSDPRPPRLVARPGVLVPEKGSQDVGHRVPPGGGDPCVDHGGEPDHIVRDPRRPARRKGLKITDQEREIGIGQIVPGHRVAETPALRIHPVADRTREGFIRVGRIFPRGHRQLSCVPGAEHLFRMVERRSGHGPHPRSALGGPHPAAAVAFRAGGHGTRKGDTPGGFGAHLLPRRQDPVPVHPHSRVDLGRGVRRAGMEGGEGRHGGEGGGKEECCDGDPRSPCFGRPRRWTGHRATSNFRASRSMTSACTIPSITHPGIPRRPAQEGVGGVVHLVPKVGAEGPLDRDDVGKAPRQKHPVRIRLEIRRVFPEHGRGVVFRVDRDRDRPDLLPVLAEILADPGRDPRQQRAYGGAGREDELEHHRPVAQHGRQGNRTAVRSRQRDVRHGDDDLGDPIPGSPAPRVAPVRSGHAACRQEQQEEGRHGDDPSLSFHPEPPKCR